jgi:toxin ParE1/3/4
MTLPIRLLPEARAEFDAAADWYEQRRSGLGIEFVNRVRDALQRVADHPESKAIVYKDVRQASIRQFPYVIVYRNNQNEILVIAIFHTARDEATWKSRISK